MPVRNRRRAVSHAIWHYLRQDDEPHELVVVDDGRVRRRARSPRFTDQVCPAAGAGPGRPPGGTTAAASEAQPTMRRLRRDLGQAIRESEQTLRELTLKTTPETAKVDILDHWRDRNSLARYRMHSKSAWFTLSLVLLYLALLLAAASVL